METRAVYSVAEIFLSVQGEGYRTGTLNVFVRFAGCNLQCIDLLKVREMEGNPTRPLGIREIDAGFTCDTDFHKGTKYTREALVAEILKTSKEGNASDPCKNIIFTGGEPTLQIDDGLLKELRRHGFYLAIETNGTKKVSYMIHWISCSPKGGSIVLDYADEVRCVVKAGRPPYFAGIQAVHYFLSPACDAPTADRITGWVSSSKDFVKTNMDWAVQWCKMHPKWRISLQIHKILGVR